MAPVEGFAGMIAGDEPRSVIVGREVIANGGTAFDATVAMAFAMTVTIPSRVGLAGSGACMVFDSQDDAGASIAEAYEFLSRRPATGSFEPSFARAMALIHAKYGTRRWENLILPAERMARFGNSASRAYARDILEARPKVAQSLDLQSLLVRPNGRLAQEGTKLTMLEYSSVLGGIRNQGAGYLYEGPFSMRFAEASSDAGLAFTREALRGAKPEIAEPASVVTAGVNAFFVPPPVDGGIVTGQIYQFLTDLEGYSGASAGERRHLMAESGMRAFADRAAWMAPDGGSRTGADLLADDRLSGLVESYDASRRTPASSLANRPPGVTSNPYSAGFVVADRWANAVACSFTMNGLFGTGKTAPGTGVLLPEEGVAGANSLTPVIVASRANGELRFAGVANGGLAAPTALAGVMADTLIGGETLADAIAAPRVTHIGTPDVTWYEPSIEAGSVEDLRARGHRLSEAPVIGAVNALYCPDGLKGENRTCEIANDPRGFGLSARAQ